MIAGNPQTPASISLHLVCKWVELDVQANLPPVDTRYLLILMLAAVIWYWPNFAEYIRIVASLLSK